MPNPDTLKPAIETLQAKLRDQEKAVARTKELINDLCEHSGLSPLYVIQVDVGADVAALQADSFYGKALSTGVREYLELRKATAQGPATVNDIYRALVQGGYVFEAKDEDN